jgi:hypothetical protein
MGSLLQEISLQTFTGSKRPEHRLFAMKQCDLPLGAVLKRGIMVKSNSGRTTAKAEFVVCRERYFHPSHDDNPRYA